jgi:hypothetical protein
MEAEIFIIRHTVATVKDVESSAITGEQPVKAVIK